MAIQYAFVASDGQIVHILSPGKDDMFTNGQQVGEHTVVYISPRENPSDFMDTRYYRDGVFLHKPPRPGEYYDWDLSVYAWIKNWTKIELAIREKRDMLLYASDWTQIPDSPVSASKKQHWAVYRQALRDLPSTLDEVAIQSPSDVQWPSPPTT